MNGGYSVKVKDMNANYRNMFISCDCTDSFAKFIYICIELYECDEAPQLKPVLDLRKHKADKSLTS